MGTLQPVILTTYVDELKTVDSRLYAAAFSPLAMRRLTNHAVAMTAPTAATQLASIAAMAHPVVKS